MAQRVYDETMLSAPNVEDGTANEQQLEAIAPPALLRMASGETATGWVPPKLTRSLSSFFKTLPPDLLQGHLLDAREDGGEGSTTGDALSDASSSSDKSSVLADL